MKTKWAVFFLLALCGFLLILFFGIPEPNAINRTYTGVAANIRENDGSLSVNNLELSPEAAQEVLTAVQSHSYAALFPNGTVVASAPTQAVILFLIYQTDGQDAYTMFTISSAGVITIEEKTYVLFPKNDREQKQLFQTIYDIIPK